jgi:hypothetical protein
MWECKSESASKHINNTNESGSIPFDRYSSIDFIVPEAGTWDVEPAICLLHDDAVSDELEVFVDCSDVFENLD